MATINQIPTSLSLSGIIEDIIITSAATVNFKLMEGTETILEENYDPDENGGINIRLRDLLPSLLSVSIPDSDIYNQTKAYKTFDFVINGNSNLCTVVQGGINASINATTFLQANWLTWQEQSKKVKYADPEWLSYYSVVPTSVKVKAYFKDANPETITLTEFQAGKLYSINVNFRYLSGLFSSGQPVYFDIWTENSSTKLSYIQRYILTTNYFENEDIFIFANSIGGIDTVRFTGNKQEANTFQIASALFDEDTFDYDIDFKQSFTKNTGYSFSSNVRAWWNDFFNSKQKYFITTEGNCKPITISKPKAEINPLKPSTFYYTFIFALSKQTKYLNLTRAQTLPENVEIVDPDTEVFFLVPRLVEFPIATLEDTLILPIQSPFLEEWKRVSLGAIKANFLTEVAKFHYITLSDIPESTGTGTGTGTGTTTTKSGIITNIPENNVSVKFTDPFDENTTIIPSIKVYRYKEYKGAFIKDEVLYFFKKRIWFDNTGFELTIEENEVLYEVVIEYEFKIKNSTEDVDTWSVNYLTFSDGSRIRLTNNTLLTINK